MFMRRPHQEKTDDPAGCPGFRAQWPSRDYSPNGAHSGQATRRIVDDWQNSSCQGQRADCSTGRAGRWGEGTSMKLREAFLRDIVTHPDDGLRLIYADWLED